MSRYIRQLRPESTQRRVGGKAAGLASLMALQLRVPRTYVVSGSAAHRYTEGRKRLLRELESEMTLLDLPLGRGVAVRSSAAQEDGVDRSLAGAYESRLHVHDIQELLEAVQSVWTSGPRGTSEAMEVLIQEMVLPTASGASFSRNPVTGSDGVIVEAVEGTAERLLQGGVTPKRWDIRDDVVSSDWDPLPTAVLGEIAETTRRVAKRLHYPADLEWAYDGDTLWWVQVRPITSLRGLPMNSNRISREYLPGLVMPLVWSINVPMINGAWVDLFERVVGPLSIDLLSLAKRFGYRAYFNMSGMGELFRKLGLPEDALEQVLGLVPSVGGSPFGFRWKMLQHLPRLVRFVVSIWAFHRTMPRWERRMMQRFGRAEEELAGVDGLDHAMQWSDRFLPLMRESSRKRILSLLLHMAIGQLARRRWLEAEREEAALSSSQKALLACYDPSTLLHELGIVLQALPCQARRELLAASPAEFPDQELGGAAGAAMHRFMERFGHVSESGNDFSAPCWKENPGLLLRLALQAVDDAGSGMPTVESGLQTPRQRRWSRRLALRRLDRERVGYVASRGFHLLRQWALRCGRMLLESGWLTAMDDVFLFSVDELRAIADGRLAAEEAKRHVTRRKKEMSEAESRSLPDTILGDDVPDSIPSDPEGKRTLRGIGTSRGIFEGKAYVIRTMKAFGDFREGGVLVVPYSDIAWSPLFARAGAVVAEAGGLLSHSSIVAREARIPAVVSVLGACTKLEGKQVIVDGHNGTITIVG